MRRFKLGLILLLVLAVECTSLPEPQPVQSKIALESFSDCEALEKYIEDVAVADMRARLSANKESISRSGSRSFIGCASDAPKASEAGAVDPGAGPSAYTQTNLQVPGVDEADFVKNDGTHIYVLSGKKLYVTKSWPADQMALLSSLEIEGNPREMFLDEKNRVVVFSSQYEAYDRNSEPFWDYDLYMEASAAPCSNCRETSVKVTVVDASDPAALSVLREEYLPGAYAHARRIGSSVRLVLRNRMHWPSGIRASPSVNDPLYQDHAREAAAYDQLMDENEKLIRSQSLSFWLPPARHRAADGTMAEVAYRCQDFQRSNAPTQLGAVTVATLNLDAPGQELQRSSLLGQVKEIYASATALYVANWHWWWWPRAGQQDFTYLHKFDLSNPDRATYLASGVVEGHILDQFSLDEYQGHLRVATALARRVDGNFWSRSELSNRVSVLAERDGRLEVVGQSEPLAPGETLKSSRFLGERGFVVTFRQTDPLFSFDLSDPANPRKIGELHIPGFSTYLHPIDPTHLLAIGAESTWNNSGLKLSLFDVGDLAAPREIANLSLAGAYGLSDALVDHRAFTYFLEKKLLAIPYYGYESASGNQSQVSFGGFVSELRLFRINVEAAKIEPLGALSMTDLYAARNDLSWTYYYSPSVRRSVLADDFAYAISDVGIRSANINDLATPLATVELTPAK